MVGIDYWHPFGSYINYLIHFILMFLGVIAGAIIGTLVGLMLILLLVILYIKKREPPWAEKITDAVNDIDWKKPVNFLKRYSIILIEVH